MNLVFRCVCSQYLLNNSIFFIKQNKDFVEPGQSGCISTIGCACEILKKFKIYEVNASNSIRISQKKKTFSPPETRSILRYCGNRLVKFHVLSDREVNNFQI